MLKRKSPVLIVGAGPIGLSLAGDLGWRGIECTLIEKSDGVRIIMRFVIQLSAALCAEEALHTASS